MVRAFDAAVFDLDGVVTFTARVHSAAWKDLFDAFLHEREHETGVAFRAFTDDDYRTYVDGRPRLDGIRTFLAARGIRLPDGSADDAPDARTVAGLGNRKNQLFHERLRRGGVDVDPAAIAFIGSLRSHGIKIGAASSSRNAAMILDTAGLSQLFDVRVDGITIERLGLRGKPAPDLFVACLGQLGADPARSMVVEDSTVGVEAGRAGAFGLVLGIDRRGHAAELREHGADWVIGDFREVSYERVDAWFRKRIRQDRCA